MQADCKKVLTSGLSFFLLYSAEFNHHMNLFFLHCHHVDFVTMSCFFQAPWQ